MSESPHAPLPVICDRCRAEGLAGDDPFAAFGDLLDFAPVPRLKNRADGWDAQRQRAFVAALSLTGSIRAAARAVGKAPFGVDQLLATPGSEGFSAAMDEAFAIAADERSRRLAEGLRAVAAEQSGWRPPAPPWSQAATRAQSPTRPARGIRPFFPPPPETEEEDTRRRVAFLKDVVRKYQLKLEAEREARTHGRIAEADFYLRQVTWLEVMLDLGSGDGFAFLRDLRVAGHSPVDIAATPLSELLDAARRDHWVACGDPPRPEHPLRHLLVDHGRFSTEPLEFTRSGQPESHDEQRSAFARRHEEDARAQVRWEAQARRDYESRRDRAADP